MAKSETRLADINSLAPYHHNARTHPHDQIVKLARAIDEFGFVGSIVIRNGTIAKGHGTLQAVKMIYGEGRPIYPVPGAAGGAKPFPKNKVPIFNATGWSDAQFRAFVIADNAIALRSGWDQGMLAAELGELADMKFDLTLTGLDPDLIAKAEEPIPQVDKKPLTAHDYGGGTSIGRSAAPIKHWRQAGLLNGEILDFGCGQDTHEYAKYDIIHHPDPAPLLRAWDTVMCNYVLNVQPVDHLITQILVMLYHLAKPGGTVLVSVRNDVQKSGVTARGYQVKRSHTEWHAHVNAVLEGCEDVKGSSFSGFIYHKE